MTDITSPKLLWAKGALFLLYVARRRNRLR